MMNPSPPRGHYDGGGGSRYRNVFPSLLVHNIGLDCRVVDLQKLFGKYGSIKDVYLPRDYNTGKPKGIGFIEFVNPADAAEAKVHMDGEVVLGRELSVIFAKRSRKKPSDMMTSDPGSKKMRSRSNSPSPPKGGNGRMRRAYSPSPSRGDNGRMERSPSPRGRYDGGGGSGSRDFSSTFLVRNLRRDRDLSATLFVRNLHRDCMVEVLQRLFGKYGPIKDIYLPRDHYTRYSKGIGFIKFANPADAAEAKVHMHGEVLLGRELTVVFAEHGRKKSFDTRTRDPGRGPRNDRRRSPKRYFLSPRHSRSPPPRCSRSPPPRHVRSRSRSHEDYSPRPKGKKNSRSVCPEERSHERGLSPQKEHSPDSTVGALNDLLNMIMEVDRYPVRGEKVVRRRKPQ